MATTSTIDKAAAANRCNLVMIGLLIWWTPDPFRILNARRGRVRRSRQCFTLSRQCFRRSRQCFRRSEQSLGIALSALFRNPSDTDIERPSLMDKASSNGWMKLHLRTRAKHCPSGTNSCLSSTLDKTWLSARNASSTWAKNLSSSHPGHPSSSSPGHSSSSHPGHPSSSCKGHSSSSYPGHPMSSIQLHSCSIFPDKQRPERPCFDESPVEERRDPVDCM